MANDSFEKILASKRHKELTTSIGEIKAELSKDDDSKVLSEIKQQTIALKSFISSISSLPKSTVNVNQDAVVSTLQKVGSDIVNSLQKDDGELDGKILLVQKSIEKLEQEQVEILNRKKEWEFSVKRDNLGFIQTVTAKQIK